MTNAEMELSSELWSAGESERHSSSSQSEILSSSRKRAAKRSVPEDEKDMGYWVRRQRNNAAARRSRETKRLQVSFLSPDSTVLNARKSWQSGAKLLDCLHSLKLWNRSDFCSPDMMHYSFRLRWSGLMFSGTHLTCKEVGIFNQEWFWRH